MTTNPTGTVFVAGASGVVGIRLCGLLVADGWSVIGMTRSEAGAARLAAIGVEPAVVDVYDLERLRQAVCRARPAAVVHQLTDLPDALDPAQMAEARIRNARIRDLGTRNLVDATVAAGARRMVAQSIAFAYAPGPMPYREDAPLHIDDPALGPTARAVHSLEQQLMAAPLDGLVLRYGKLYGPGTGFDSPASGGPVHVDAAADAARKALVQGPPGIYNIAEDDGTVSSESAVTLLGWRSTFRIGAAFG